MTGTVKFFNDSKGFGFITNEKTGIDIFVHVSNLTSVELHKGDHAEYTEEEEEEEKDWKLQTCRYYKYIFYKF